MLDIPLGEIAGMKLIADIFLTLVMLIIIVFLGFGVLLVRAGEWFYKIGLHERQG
jgi:uncharacterized membrane protein